MEEEEGRVVKAQEVHSVVGSFNLPHLLQLVALGVADQLGNCHEIAPVGLKLLKNAGEEGGALHCQQLLKDYDGSEGVEQTLDSFLHLGQQGRQVLQEHTLQLFLPLFLLRVAD